MAVGKVHNYYAAVEPSKTADGEHDRKPTQKRRRVYRRKDAEKAVYKRRDRKENK